MLVEVQMNRMGAVTLTPVSKKVRRQMRAHNQEWLGHPDEDVYLQGDRGYEFLDMLSPAQRRDVEEGWGATVRMDPWIFGHYVGYDFHEVIKP